MRKILLSVFAGLTLIATIFFMVNGFNKFNVKGFSGLDEKNTQVENKISDLSNVITVKYTQAESNQKTAANKLIDSKTEYENQAYLSSTNRSSYASMLEAYDIDYLWTKLGNYAKEEGVVIKIDVMSSSASSNLYDLNFAVTGTYVGSTDFIYDIENDSKLGFKIDNFSMSSNTTAEVIASFVCKDIPIKVGDVERNTTTEEEKNTTNNSTSNNTKNASNTTNSTTSNTTTNTTNTTNSKNTTSSNTTDYISEMGNPNKSNLTSINEYVGR